jgi:hypothetical protein
MSRSESEREPIGSSNHPGRNGFPTYPALNKSKFDLTRSVVDALNQLQGKRELDSGLYTTVYVGERSPSEASGWLLATVAGSN